VQRRCQAPFLGSVHSLLLIRTGVFARRNLSGFDLEAENITTGVTLFRMWEGSETVKAGDGKKQAAKKERKIGGLPGAEEHA
jgi:hypothetical protein